MRVQLQEIPDWSPPPAVCCARALNRWNANLAVQNCRWANWNVPIQLATQNIPQRKMQARSFPPLMQVSRVPLQPKETVENVATPTDAGGNPWHASPHVAYHSAFGCLNGHIPARLESCSFMSSNATFFKNSNLSRLFPGMGNQISDQANSL